MAKEELAQFIVRIGRTQKDDLIRIGSDNNSSGNQLACLLIDEFLDNKEFQKSILKKIENAEE